MPPKVIGPYRVLETLGSGGVGTVYRALDRRTNEAVALKLLAAGPALDPRAARRLAREFEALQDLSHPNVVKVYDTGVYHGYPYLTMELVEGLTLRHYLSFSDEDLISVSRAVALNISAKGAAMAKEIARVFDSPSSDSFQGHPDRGADEPDDPSEEPTGEWDPSEAPGRGGRGRRDEDDDDDEEERFILGESGDDEAPSNADFDSDSGPDSLRAFADALEEPDTHSQGDFALKLDQVKGAGKLLPAEKPRLVNLEAYNKPERVAKLKDSMLQLCLALSYVHARGLIHRDLKPSNVMVDQERVVRLMDFGLAKFLAVDDGVTADGRLVGTFRYMSPEQILGEPLDARSDLYSLGVIMYELLSGRAPFEAKTPYELWEKVLETDAPSLLALNPKADGQLVRVAHKLIRKDAEERYQTAEEVYEALSE
ncbi:MAG TPA: serine/threonine-protein kinase [Myxococcaceae bacterium]|nr:serine/threonine-protein kinase [Myxococcaceae bacterium]